MGIFYSTILMQPGVPDVSQMVSPEAMLVTSVTVACLGLAVMMLSRPRTEQLVPASLPEGDNAGGAEEQKAAPESPSAENQPVAAGETVTKESPAEAIPAAVMNAAAADPAHGPAADSAAMICGGPAGEPAAARSASQPAAERLCETPASAGTGRAATHGASALIAKVASLLPAGTAAPRDGKNSTARAARGPAGFQPAGRFSRSQQAFLRIPIVLTGRNESGKEFREETCTLILLPQGAVIPMRQKVRAGDRMTLSNPTRQKEVECEVYGAQPGPDGRLLVEVEFPEPQKSMWPVSFPAWAGNGPASGPGKARARAGARERVSASDDSGT